MAKDDHRNKKDQKVWAKSLQRAATRVLLLAVFLAATALVYPQPGSASPATSNTLAIGEVMRPGTTLTSQNGYATLSMQMDGNFVLYAFGRPVWATSMRNVTPQPGSTVTFTNDSRLVLYSPSKKVLWASPTRYSGAVEAVVTNDANILVVTSSALPLNTAIWGTGINANPAVTYTQTSFWSGYSIKADPGTRVHAAQLSATIPDFTCKNTMSYTYAWAGIDGALFSPTVQQDGVDLYCGQGADGAYHPYVFAWYELYPSPPVIVPWPKLPVHIGDTVTSNVTESATTVTFTITNLSTGAAWSKTLQDKAPQRATAECIVENPGTPPQPSAYQSMSLSGCDYQLDGWPFELGLAQGHGQINYYNACTPATIAYPSVFWSPEDFTVRATSYTPCPETRPATAQTTTAPLPANKPITPSLTDRGPAQGA